MGNFYWDNSGDWSNNTAGFDPGSISGGFIGGQAYGSDMPDALSSMLGQQDGNGLFGSLFGGQGGLMGGLMGVGQLANMFMNWGMQRKYMNMMNDQLDMAKERWSMTKDELNRIKGTRERLNNEYMGNPAPASNTSAPAASNPSATGYKAPTQSVATLMSYI